MSLRYSHLESREARRICLSFSYGRGTRSISIRPFLFYIIAGVLPVLALWYLFATVYLIFRDDMLASLMNRQAEMQYAYEDRITSLRAQLDQSTSRHLLDEAAISAKMEDLASRQVRLERRSAVVTSLAERVLPKPDAKGSLAQAQSTRAPSILVQGTPAAGDAHARQASPHTTPNPLLSGAFSPSPSQALPQGVAAFAPLESAPHEALQESAPATKPRPDGLDLRHSEDSGFPLPAAPEKTSDARDPGDGAESLSRMTASLDRIEKDQDRIVARLQTPLIGEMTRVRIVLAQAGLSDRLALRQSFPVEDRKTRDAGSKTAGAESAVGGPFIPLKLDADGSAFERAAVSLQEAILAVEHMRRAISSVPLRKPLAGDPDVTSGFGARLDPFFGRPAMHAGIDLREDYGTDVHATASGKVTIAGPDGGYGNMVEIDHGNGLSTRYAHMASITVTEGQVVQAGQVVGHIGMTGRTTGPHLHYETRIDGEPVDPLRFLKAGNRLFSENPDAFPQD
jgi:murein DD-endopeptidase MepM/ murein hydrolase activator NlpD